MAGNSQSAAEPEQPESSSSDEAILNVDFVELESSGLLSSFRDGSLGKDVWHSSTRSDLVAAMKHAGPEIRSPVVTRLMLRLLLSRSDAQLVQNDSEPAAGEDLFTLRLQKLVEMGAHQKALDMYGLRKDPPYHPELARAGALAMLGSGNAPLACLESRSTQGRFSGISFWDKLAALCATILPSDTEDSGNAASALEDSKVLSRIASDETFRIPFARGSQFDEFSSLERSAIFGLGRVEYGAVSDARFRSISAEVLGLVLHDESLPDDWRFIAGVEALSRGLRDIDVIRRDYDDAIKAASGAVPEAASFSDWTELPDLYASATKAPHGDGQWNYLLRAIQITPEEKVAALSLFVDLFANATPPSDTSGHFLIRGGSLMLSNGRALPDPWRNALESLAESPDEEWSKDAALVLIADEVIKNSRDLSATIGRLGSKLEPEEMALVAPFPHSLDISSSNALETGAPYDKGAGLTFGKDYVMPSVILMDYLDKTIEQKTLGGVILFSAIAFKNQKPSEMFPGMLRTVVTGFRVVGLNDEARRIAAEAIIGQTGE
ncbi:MAG: hypothetical protein EOM26_03335 [Alphaproteobacteria bacterium]|nr:hypothetical protein [Alphaproteobacteria bacterium]